MLQLIKNTHKLYKKYLKNPFHLAFNIKNSETRLTISILNSTITITITTIVKNTITQRNLMLTLVIARERVSSLIRRVAVVPL